MVLLEKMVSAWQTQLDLPVRELAGCIERCLEAEAVAIVCADACSNLLDPRPMQNAQRRLVDAADCCAAVVRMLCRSGQPDPSALRALLEACSTLCRGAAAACGEHATTHEPCAIAAEATFATSRAVSALLEALLEAPTA